MQLVHSFSPVACLPNLFFVGVRGFVRFLDFLSGFRGAVEAGRPGGNGEGPGRPAPYGQVSPVALHARGRCPALPSLGGGGGGGGKGKGMYLQHGAWYLCAV